MNLFLIQLIWASSYTFQKMALVEMPLGLVLILRYGLASLFFLIAGHFSLKEKFTKKEWGLIFLVGVINFAGSPFFQLQSLQLTYAIDAAILVAFEPIITTLLAVLILKEKLAPSTAWAFLVATAGTLLMSTSKGGAQTFQWARILGDFIFLGALICEGFNSITSRHLAQKYHPLRLVAWMVFAGFLANLMGNFSLLTLKNLKAISLSGWFDVFYLSLFCTCVGYGVWTHLLKKFPVNQVALSLFLQPFLGTLLAVLILKERPDLQTIFGGILILSTLFFWLRKRQTQEVSPASSLHGENRDTQTRRPSSPSIQSASDPQS